MLDFVLAAIGLLFLGFGIWGAYGAIRGGLDIAALRDECPQDACTHQGTLVGRDRTNLRGTGLFGPALTLDYCVLTLDLDVGRVQTAILGSGCGRLAAPSPVSAVIWIGTVVSVETAAGRFDTYRHPSVELFNGLLRALALVPAVLCAAMIHYDLARHRPVWRIGRRRTKKLG